MNASEHLSGRRLVANRSEKAQNRKDPKGEQGNLPFPRVAATWHWLIPPIQLTTHGGLRSCDSDDSSQLDVAAAGSKNSRTGVNFTRLLIPIRSSSTVFLTGDHPISSRA